MLYYLFDFLDILSNTLFADATKIKSNRLYFIFCFRCIDVIELFGIILFLG